MFASSSGEIHMSVAAERTGVEGLVRIAAAVRIADGTGPASSSDLFLTPMSGLYIPSTGDVLLVASGQASAAVVVDTDGACPAAGCNASQVLRAAAAAGASVPAAPVAPSGGNGTRRAAGSDAASLVQLAAGPRAADDRALQPGAAPAAHPGRRAAGTGSSPSARVVGLPAMAAPARCTVVMRGTVAPAGRVSIRAGARGPTASAGASAGRRLAAAGSGSVGPADDDPPRRPPWWWTLGSAIAGRLPPPPHIAGEPDEPSAFAAASDGASLLQHAASGESRPVPAASETTTGALARPGTKTHAGPWLSSQEPAAGQRPAAPGRVAPSTLAAVRAASRLFAFERLAAEAAAGSAAAGTRAVGADSRLADSASASAGRQLAPRGPAPSAAPSGRRLDATDATSGSKEEEEAAAEAEAAAHAPAATPGPGPSPSPGPADPTSPAMLAFARSMGLNDEFRAPGAGAVGRYVSRGRGGTRPSVLLIQGIIVSPDCGFAANFTTAAVVFDGDAVALSGSVHSVIMMTLSILHFGFNVRAILDSLNAQVTATRTSAAAVGIGMAVDAWLCIIHGVLPLAVPDLGAGFGVVAVLLLLTFSVLEFRLVLSIAKAQHPEAFDDMAGVRGVLSRVYGRFYAVLGVSVALAVAFPATIPALIVAGSSFWLPQIVHSATIGAPDGMTLGYIATATLVRAYPILFLLGCPANFLSALGIETQDPALAVGVAAWLALQVAVMLLQRRLGPQFLVPTAFLPERYDYHRAVTIKEGQVVKTDDDGAPAEGARGGDAEAAGGQPATRLGAWWSGVVRAVRRGRSRAARFSLWQFGPVRRRYAALPDVDADAAAGAEGGAAMAAPPGPPGARDLEAGGPHDGARLADGVVPMPPAEGDEGRPDDADPGRNPDCVVCMTPVELPAAPGSYMVTPCHHIFHDECLRQWLNVKMQCPTCRAPVPAP